MPAISQREREVLDVIKDLGGTAHPTNVGKAMGITGDYAEQMCDYLVWKKYLTRQGLKFKVIRDWDGLWVKRVPYEAPAS